MKKLIKNNSNDNDQRYNFMLEPVLRPPHSFAFVSKMTKKSKRKSGRVSANISHAVDNNSKVYTITTEYIAL